MSFPSGGEAKWFLAENTVLVDGEFESRRGRKLYKGMTIKVLNKEYKNLYDYKYPA